MPEDKHDHEPMSSTLEGKAADKLASDRALMRWIIVACIGGAAYLGAHMLGRENKHSTFLETSIISTMAKLADNQTATLNNQAQQIRDAAEAARNLEELTRIAESQSRTMETLAGFMRDIRDDTRKFPAVREANAKPEQP